MTRLFIIAALILTPVIAEAKGKKSKPAPVAVQPVAPAPAPVQPAAPKRSYMDQQIARALANTRPLGVTTYGVMAAAVAAGQNGGDPVAAAQAASQGF